jgi:hypothetical protein
MVEAAEMVAGAADWTSSVEAGGFALNVGLSSVGGDAAGQDQTGSSGDNCGLAAHATGVVADGLGNDSSELVLVTSARCRAMVARVVIRFLSFVFHGPAVAGHGLSTRRHLGGKPARLESDF